MAIGSPHITCGSGIKCHNVHTSAYLFGDKGRDDSFYKLTVTDHIYAETMELLEQNWIKVLKC